MILGGTKLLADEFHPVGRHVGGFEDVGRTAQGDVGIHLADAEQFECGGRGVLRLGGAAEQFAVHAGVVDLHEGNRAEAARGAHEFDHDLVRHIEGVDQDAFALGQMRGITGENLGEPGQARIVHGSEICRTNAGAKGKTGGGCLLVRIDPIVPKAERPHPSPGPAWKRHTRSATFVPVRFAPGRVASLGTRSSNAATGIEERETGKNART